VNRLLILVALLAVFLAACGTQRPDDADATLTPEPTQAATEAPDDTDEPEATDDGDGDGDGGTGSLDDMIPDELNGVAGTPIPGMDAIISGALSQQGLDAGDAEFAFVTYGTGTDAIVLNAFRIPGVSDVAMQQLAQLMSGAGVNSGLEAEPVTIGGKSVLSFSGGQTPGAVYFYVVDDIAFTVAGENEELAEQLLSELP
jgi:hypothetical protein